MSERERDCRCLEISNRGTITSVLLETIFYVESRHRRVIVYTGSERYEYYERLSCLEELLKQDGFLRCHQSYLVALDKITAYRDNALQVGPYEVPVSRRYHESVAEWMSQREMAAESETGTDGVLVCVKGACAGKMVRMVPEQVIVVGRDGGQADIVINLPLVSRKHCTLVYHSASKDYEVTDWSSNGTFIDGDHRLERGDTYCLKPGSTLSFGDRNLVYCLR